MYRAPPKPLRFESGFPGRHCDIASGLSAPTNSVLLRSSAQWLGMRGAEVPAAKSSSVAITARPPEGARPACVWGTRSSLNSLSCFLFTGKFNNPHRRTSEEEFKD